MADVAAPIVGHGTNWPNMVAWAKKAHNLDLPKIIPWDGISEDGRIRTSYITQGERGIVIRKVIKERRYAFVVID